MAMPQVEAFRGTENLIRIVGHRGVRGLLPENSMIGFEFTLLIGVRLLEFDVMLTGDEVPVITHDHRLHTSTFTHPDGMSGKSPKVSELTFAELESYEIGRIDSRSDYGRRFPDQVQIDGLRVPRLGALLDLAVRPENADTYLMLELKSDPAFATETKYRQNFVQRVMREVQAKGLTSRTLLHSFDWNLLAECQRLYPEMPTSFLTQLTEDEDDRGEGSTQSVRPDFQGVTHAIPDMVKDAGGALWCPHVDDVTADGVARARELGLCVAAWTVNEPADIERMIGVRVDAIVTDYPGRVQQKLSEHGIAWAD